MASGRRIRRLPRLVPRSFDEGTLNRVAQYEGDWQPIRPGAKSYGTASSGPQVLRQACGLQRILGTRFGERILGLLAHMGSRWHRPGWLRVCILAGRIKFGIDRVSLISRPTRLAIALGGGMIGGFSTRTTRGCTSHHLSESSLLSLGSWLFLGAAFVGGFATAFMFKKVWR
jgi:hypothetical protein